MSTEIHTDRLFAVRGANSVASNDAAAIGQATKALLEELMSRNGLRTEEMVSCIFTTTDDLDAEFPAVAAREIGLDRVPLLCAREIAVPGALPLVVRVLLHYYADREHRPEPVYLGSAKELRTDLGGAG
mgnify:CR=1 FL=1